MRDLNTNKKENTMRSTDPIIKEYTALKNKSFVTKDDLRRMEEIGRILDGEQSEFTGELWNMKDNKKTKVKFRKSKRVTNFTRDRR